MAGRKSGKIENWPAGGGATGALIRGRDWAATPLGPTEYWPLSLRKAVELMLAARQPVYIAWGQSLISLYNDSYIPLLGVKHPDAFGRSFDKIWPEIGEEYRPAIEATLRGEPQYFVDRPIPLSGRPGRPMSWFTFSWTPLRDETGKVCGFLNAATETTDRIIAERTIRERTDAALRESETRYRILFDSIDQGFCVIQMIYDDSGKPADYRFLEINAAFERQTGLIDAEGKLMRSFAPQHEQFWFDTYGRIALTGESERFEHTAAQLGRHYEVFAFRVGEPEERKVGVLFNDITARKQAEAALRESEARFRIMADDLPLVIWVHDEEGNQRFVNRTFYEYFAVSREAVQTQKWKMLIHPDDSERYISEFQSCVKLRSPFHAECRVCRADGEWRWLESWGRPRFDGTGRFLGYVGTSADITERKRAEELHRLMVDELNHRVKNTLAIVQGIALQSFKGAGEPARAAVAAFQDRLGALAAAHNLLTQSNWRSTSLKELTNETLKAGCIQSGSIQIAGPPVELQPKQAVSFALTLHELCTNAIKHGALSDPGGHVDVTWRAGEGDGRFRLVWKERGGPPVEAPQQRGFGLRLIEQALASELDGEVQMNFEPEGLVCTIEGSLSDERSA